MRSGAQANHQNTGSCYGNFTFYLHQFNFLNMSLRVPGVFRTILKYIRNYALTFGKLCRCSNTELLDGRQVFQQALLNTFPVLFSFLLATISNTLMTPLLAHIETTYICEYFERTTVLTPSTGFLSD